MAKENLNSHAQLEAGYAKLGQDEKLDSSSHTSQSWNRSPVRRIAYYVVVAVTSILAGYVMAPIVVWLISNISPSCHRSLGHGLEYDGTTLVTEIYQVPTTALAADDLDKLVIDEIETTGLDKLQKRQDDPIDTTPGSGEGDDTTSTEEETTSTNEESVTDTSVPDEPTDPVTSNTLPTDSVSTTTESIPEVPTTTTEDLPTTVTTETTTESEPEAPSTTTTSPSTTSETETSTEAETTEAPSTSSEAETTSAGTSTRIDSTTSSLSSTSDPATSSTSSDSETSSVASTTVEPPTTTTTEEESETTTTEGEPSSSLVHETFVETLENGVTTVITSTSWVEVKPTSGSEPSDPELQNAASRPTAMVLSLMMVFSAMILLG